MGAKHSFRSPAGGGCPFLYAPWMLPGFPFPAPLVANFQPIGANFQQKRAKINYFLGVFGVFSGFWETENGKSEIYFYFEGLQGFRCGSLWGGGGVHWVQVVQGAGASGVLSWCVFRAFVRLVALLAVRWL